MMIVLATLLVLISAIALFWVIAHDGYGSRPAPRSHYDDFPPGPYYGPRILS